MDAHQTRLEHEVETLSARAFGLARDVIDKKLTAEAAHDSAQTISGEIDTLLPQVHALQTAELKMRLLGELADADLECRYVLEGEEGAVSLRLSHYMQR